MSNDNIINFGQGKLEREDEAYRAKLDAAANQIVQILFDLARSEPNFPAKIVANVASRAAQRMVRAALVGGSPHGYGQEQLVVGHALQMLEKTLANVREKYDLPVRTPPPPGTASATLVE